MSKPSIPDRAKGDSIRFLRLAGLPQVDLEIPNGRLPGHRLSPVRTPGEVLSERECAELQLDASIRLEFGGMDSDCRATSAVILCLNYGPAIAKAYQDDVLRELISKVDRARGGRIYPTDIYYCLLLAAQAPSNTTINTPEVLLTTATRPELHYGFTRDVLSVKFGMFEISGAQAKPLWLAEISWLHGRQKPRLTVEGDALLHFCAERTLLAKLCSPGATAHFTQEEFCTLLKVQGFRQI